MWLYRDPFRSPRRGIDDDISEGFDELATVGFLEDTEVSAVFEPTGENTQVVFFLSLDLTFMIHFRPIFVTVNVQCLS